MTREELLAALHNIDFGAEATVATMDMGLQYDYVTKEGAGTGFGGMGRWPAYYLGEISSFELSLFKTKIKSQALSDADFLNTALENFHNDVFISINRLSDQVPSDKYADLLNIPSDYAGKLYCLCDSGQWEPELLFFTCESDLIKGFEEQYVFDIVRWEDMEDDELEEWIDRINDGLQGVEMMYYSGEEADE